MADPMEPTRSKRRLLPMAVAGVLFVAGSLVLWFFPPSENNFYPKCMLHSQTGLHCPGCGFTRSAYSLLHGDVLQALAYNVLWPLVFPMLLWGFATSLWNSTFPDRWVRTPFPKWFIAVSPWILMGVLLLFGLLRNIPAEPFNLLAPHELNRHPG